MIVSILRYYFIAKYEYRYIATAAHRRSESEAQSFDFFFAGFGLTQASETLQVCTQYRQHSRAATVYVYTPISHIFFLFYY